MNANAAGVVVVDDATKGGTGSAVVTDAVSDDNNEADIADRGDFV